MPLIKKKVTVDGSAVAKPDECKVLIGTPLKEVLSSAADSAMSPGR